MFTCFFFEKVNELVPWVNIKRVCYEWVKEMKPSSSWSWVPLLSLWLIAPSETSLSFSPHPWCPRGWGMPKKRWEWTWAEPCRALPGAKSPRVPSSSCVEESLPCPSLLPAPKKRLQQLIISTTQSWDPSLLPKGSKWWRGTQLWAVLQKLRSLPRLTSVSPRWPQAQGPQSGWNRKVESPFPLLAHHQSARRRPGNPLLFKNIIFKSHSLEASRESRCLRTSCPSSACAHLLVTQSCPTLCDPVDCGPPGPPVRGILQARVLERVAIPSSRGSSQLRDQTEFSPCKWTLSKKAPLSARHPAKKPALSAHSLRGRVWLSVLGAHELGLISETDNRRCFYISWKHCPNSPSLNTSYID